MAEVVNVSSWVASAPRFYEIELGVVCGASGTLSATHCGADYRRFLSCWCLKRATDIAHWSCVCVCAFPAPQVVVAKEF